jgi:hypothetical protein
MGFSRRPLILIQFVAALGVVFNPQFASAYDHPLSDDAVREAYFVGQDVKNVNKFLSQYFRGLPVPQRGPYISEIELSTPYAQVVEISAQHSVGYSDMRAAEDYRKRGDYMVVRVKVLFTPTYANRANDFWRGISVRLIQKTNQMPATSIDGQSIYSDGGGGTAIGADLLARFSVVGVKSESLQVEVLPPEGPAVYATFDLHSLR